MPFKLDTETREIHCSWCKQVIRGKPIVVKTCCNNKPFIFCSSRCYNNWMREWLKRQEQIKGKGQLL
ncbi:hypothetical protein HLB03_05780 [Acidianus sp. DSM 29099]|nr:hypothetical protein [Acidianus sp. RZ1]